MGPIIGKTQTWYDMLEVVLNGINTVLFNCSRTMFEAIIVNMYVLFNAKLFLDRFDFSSDFFFTPLTFCVLP